jgi:hypothetical protein
MTVTETDASKAQTSLWSRLLRRLLACVRFLFWFLLVAWGTLVIYYSNLPWAWLRLVLAAVFAAFSVWAIWIARRPRMRLAFCDMKSARFRLRT